ncbi:hypothetical protein ABZS77_10650 [Micromonospora sp. NPDC005298]|uniref:hypothetical protein n=1 Tax=Micromonospora sp. NPDC005298 TaxID=3156873 RepID=UPI0033A1704B
MSVWSRGTGGGRRCGGSRRRVAVLPVVLSAVVLSAAGCQRPEPGSVSGERQTASAQWRDLSMLLGAGELGSNWREGDARVGLPPWPWEQSTCPHYRSDDYPARSYRQGAVERFYHPSDGSSPAHHVVEKFEPGWAERDVEDVRRVLARCASYRMLGSHVSFSIVDSRYRAGTGLLIRGGIEHAASPPTVTYFVVLRRGEMVSTFSLPDPGSRAVLDSIAARVEARLG